MDKENQRHRKAAQAFDGRYAAGSVCYPEELSNSFHTAGQLEAKRFSTSGLTQADDGADEASRVCIARLVKQGPGISSLHDGADRKSVV